MRKNLLAAAMITFVSAGMAMAGTATSTFSVTSSVAANCKISATTLAFGAYDPVDVNASTALDQTGSVTVNCTKGAAIWVGLNLGANASGTIRRMKNGSDYLSYELYKLADYATVCGNSVESDGVSWTSTSKADHAFTIYGRVPAAQDVTTGSYSDTITATVNF